MKELQIFDRATNLNKSNASCSKPQPTSQNQPSCSYADVQDRVVPEDTFWEAPDENSMEITNEVFKEIQSRSNIKVPINVQQNLKKLVAEHEQGIWCASIPSFYK